MNRFKTYHSRVYRDFKAIPVTDYRATIRYFETHEEQILELGFEEYFELLTTYTNALFETGKYQKHELMANVVIEASIENNIHIYKGEDIYFSTLFKKAASYYNLGDYKKTIYILKELIRINPQHEDSILFYKKCLRHKRSPAQKKARALAMICFLLTPLVISVQVLIVSPFYENLESAVIWTRNIIFALGWVIFGIGDITHRIEVSRKVKHFLANIREAGDAVVEAQL